MPGFYTRSNQKSILFTHKVLNLDVLYVSTGLKQNRTRMFKSLSILENMHPDDRNVFACNITDKGKNRPDNLHSVCLADIASSHVSKKACDVPLKPNEIKSYTVPVSNINDVEPKNIIALTHFSPVSHFYTP